ncbi:hypothetical protein AB0O34_05525 [Sphaerisporangium sp. NPDC088356]|uniref:hypothetical protein n=1 Tax=Sphaerisporangium sp. NPDC088356 TaxID=3154871 RepID=UPI0034243F6D
MNLAGVPAPGPVPGPAGRLPHAAYALVPSRFLPRRLVPRSRWLPGRRRLPQGPGTIEGYLSEVLGEPVRATSHVRPALRVNRKPVLEIHGATGKRLAFVKIGDSDRSRALVRHESATLAQLAATPLKVVVSPAVLHHGVWNGLEVLVLSPLPVRRGRVSSFLPVGRDRFLPVGRRVSLSLSVRKGRVSPSLLNSAVAEIATLGPALADHAGAARQDAGADRRDARPLPGSLSPEPGARGDHAWHGDFSPWNMAPSPDGRLFVWDWERFATGVPLGFDALHHFFQRALRRMPPPVAAEACLAQAVRTLAPFGLSAGEAREAAVRYLIALADRYERDGHQPLGPPSQWLNPLVDHQEVLP